jgi:hypothetical protein
MTLEAWRTPELRELLGAAARDIRISRGRRHLASVDAALAVLRPGAGGRQVSYVARRARRLGGRVLVTQIENYDFFGFLATSPGAPRVVAVQNGVRLAHELATLRASLRGAPQRAQGLLHDVFVCWGRSDVDRMRGAGLTARVALPVGSLRDSLHRADTSRDLPESPLAVVLVKPKTFASSSDPYRTNQAASRRTVLDFVARYAVGAAIVPSMVFVPGSAERLATQARLLAAHYRGPWRTTTSTDRLSSYDAVMGARTVLGDQSSLLVEALGRGKRILSVNMTEDPSLDFPMDGPWLLRRPTYEQFAERMDWIRGMSDAQWAGVIGDAPRRLVNYNPAYPTHVFVKDLVMAIAEDRPWPEVTW